MVLRDYQKELVSSALSCDCNVLLQADTGSGKTRVLATIARSSPYVLLVAHRNILISQLSLEFARAGLVHNMLASKNTIRRATSLQRRCLGKSIISPLSTRFICSVDTVLSKSRRGELLLDVDKPWLIIIDEAHHVIADNKWGKFCTIFKNSRVIGATATPSRLDGVPLKRGQGGIFDKLIQAESLKENSVNKLITRGFLSPFKCYGVKSRINEDYLVKGLHDYTTASLLSETSRHLQEMAGDAVKHYKRLANKKQAIAFCVSIDIAIKTAEKFRQEGVSSAAVHSKMSATEINRVFDLFELKQIQVICNVDITGEGVDIPAIEVLIMLRKTASLTLYRQWIGRSLRPCSGKEFAIIIDHADNIRSHGLPDDSINWRLEGPPQEQKTNLVNCEKCGFTMKAWVEKCPECGSILRSIHGLSVKDVKYIDVNLVEIHRTTQAKEKRDQMRADKINISEISHLVVSGSKTGDIATRVAFWFFNCIKEYVTVNEIEDFLHRHNNMSFWASHFTISELTTPNSKKCLRVFNEAKCNK